MILMVNTNKCKLTDLPISMFKKVLVELQNNYQDVCSRSNVLNLTWIQNKTANLLLKLCHPVVRSRVILNNSLAPP